jgi:diguanylate cyclase (GGDEF)-like protein
MFLLKEKKLLLYFTFFHYIGYFLWLFVWSKNDWTKLVGIHTFSILAPLISVITLFLVVKKSKGNEKPFWLFIALGCMNAAIGEILKGYNTILLLKSVPYPGISDFFFLLQFLFYLLAFIYEVRINSKNLHIIKFTFDTSIILTVAVVFSWHLILHPIIIHHHISYLDLLVSLGYPMGDLILLFGAVSIYLGSENVFPPKVSYLMIGSLLIQIVTDTASRFLHQGSQEILGPYWSIAPLLMGLAAIYSLDSIPKNSKNNKESRISLRLLLPYLSVILLFMVIIFQNNEFNSLIFGTAVAIFLVLFRQVFTGIENQTLLVNYHNLTEELEQKIGERTKELSSKNQELITAVQRMKHMAFHDVLSGLPNRRLFQERLVTSMDEAIRNRSKIAVVFIDLDRFKNINDTLGHEFGDLLLKYVSRQMVKSVRKVDTISRQGGDEFTIILNNISTKEEIIPLIERLQTIVSKPITIKGQELHVSMSIGIALYPNDGTTTEELMKNADMAMYYAKEEGRNNYKFYSQYMNHTISRKMVLENGLRKAILNDEFVLYFQPQVNIHTEKIIGVESLLRWNSVEAGMISPSEFIPVAEETGLIFPIGEWVLRTACKQGKTWHDYGHSDLKVAVNLSPLQFLHENLVDMIRTVLDETNFNPYFLELEITEGVAFHDAEEAIRKMQALRDLGVGISIDDFGTGYSSLIYLKRFPINTLKVAKPFIQDMVDNPRDKALVEAIVSMAHSLDLSVVVEGAETDTQLLALKELCCDVVQGEIFSQPLTVTQLNMMIDSKLTKQCEL